MSVKKFKDYINEEKSDKQNLADDLSVLIKNDDGDIEKVDMNEWEISKIIDVIKDPKEIETLESYLYEARGGVKLSTDLDAKDVKRGDTLWLTALLAPRNKSVAYSPGTMGVLKVRVIDIYYGLSKLKNLIK